MIAPRTAREPSRVCLVSERRTRAHDLLDPLLAIGGAPELIGWAEADRLRGPFAALVTDVDGCPDDRAGLFQLWASRAWQPATVVFLEPVRGSTLLAALLAGLGYPRVGYLKGRPSGEEVADAVRPVLEWRLWVVGLFARELRCTDPLFLHVTTLAVDGPAPVRNVQEWAKRCRRNAVAGITTVGDLRSLLHRAGAPLPKPVLDRVRLAQVIADAQAEERLPRERLARRFGYGSGDFLGRKAKRIAGVPFGELRRLDLATAVSVIAAEGLAD